MAGGKDSLDWFKDRVKQDKATSVLPPKCRLASTSEDISITAVNGTDRSVI